MGCAHCRRQQEPQGTATGPNQNGYKDLFYATNEFDLSRSQSEDEEEENFALDSMRPNKQQSTKKVISPSKELSSTNNTSSTIVNDVVNNEIVQTGV